MDTDAFQEKEKKHLFPLLKVPKVGNGQKEKEPKSTSGVYSHPPARALRQYPFIRELAGAGPSTWDGFQY